MASTVTDPRKAHTLSEFLSAMASSSAVSYYKLSFIEKRNRIEYTVKNILSDYIYELKQASRLVTLTEQQELKYFYRPKILSSDVYGSTELYYIILAINDICDIKEFNINPIRMLTKDDMTDLISKIYNIEKSAIEAYNNIHK
jgi:hypothetical protein